jgi:hypothetical protein
VAPRFINPQHLYFILDLPELFIPGYSLLYCAALPRRRQSNLRNDIFFYRVTDDQPKETLIVRI